MNIGIVSTWFERGAAYVSKQFEEILKTKHEVFIYARAGESYAIGDPKWDTPNVTWGKRINTPLVGTYISKKNFIKWIKNYKIELIIFNEQHWFEPILWCKKLGIKTVAYVDYYTELSLPLFNLYDTLICNTKRHMNAFNKHPNAVYVPWGTDISIFKPKSSGLVAKDYVTFFHSAGMNGDRKGTDIFIKALSLVSPACKYKAIIHTQNDIKTQFPELSPEIDRLSLDGKLEIINKTVTAPGLYHLGDVYVYPSRLEGIGLTIAESLACGLACIVPDNGPMNEFINESCGTAVVIEKYYSRADGYYWPKCEVSEKSLAECIEDYAINKERTAVFKENARKHAEYALSFTENFKRLFSLVEETKFTTPSESLITKAKIFDTRGVKKYNRYFVGFGFYKIFNLVNNHQKQR